MKYSVLMRCEERMEGWVSPTAGYGLQEVLLAGASGLVRIFVFLCASVTFSSGERCLHRRFHSFQYGCHGARNGETEAGSTGKACTVGERCRLTTEEENMNTRFGYCSMVFLSATLVSPVFAAGLSQKEQLGKVMYQDKDFSLNATQSCLTCHHRISGFADPTNMRDPYHTVVSLGDDGVSKGGRNAPSAAYAGFSPALAKTEKGYVGGMFWDGRATGLSASLADPLAEQAQGPPLNPVEMNMPDKEAVVQAVRDASYATLFRKVFGSTSLDNTDQAYDYIAKAIAAYERSIEVQPFSSRYDSGQLSDQEKRGENLFAINCAKCHATGQVEGAQGPLFTNYSYANIGVPANTDDQVPGDDNGLGGFLASPDAPAEFAADAGSEKGKFKVPTLRNIALTAPYSHNGYFATLRDIIRFKNTRDVATWPEPDVFVNLNYDVGNLGLSDQDIDDLVAFLVTLTDR